MARRRSGRYLSYLHSTAWFTLRSKHLARYGALCKACGSADSIQLHHKTYERLGQEKAADLVALCATCHRAVHRFAKTHRSLTLWQATDQVMKSRRGKA